MTSGPDLWPDRVRETYVVLDAALDGGVQPLAVDVPADDWHAAVLLARDGLGCGFFDWLSAVDELEDGLRLVCHLAAHRPGRVDHLLVRTLLPVGGFPGRPGHPAPEPGRNTGPVLVPRVASVADVYAGAHWHERETHEMFGIDFTVDGEVLDLAPLLLPAELDAHPLRKDFVLASRVATPWPGAKEPGESDATVSRSRRKARPPGVPDPQAWGPQAGRDD